MRTGFALPASLLAAALTAAFAAPARADVVVNIDKTTQRMTVAVDGAQRYEWPVSTGRAGYDTPNGTFKINRMDADHLSQEWDNAPMPHSMFFDMRGHAIHGFFDVKHLGLPVSHGCVRISPAHAALLFSLVKAEGLKGTSVVVSGATPRASTYVAQRRRPADAYAAQPQQIAPGYYDQQRPDYGQQQLPPQPPPYDQQSYDRQQQGAYAQPQPQQYYGQVQQPYYAQAPQPYAQPQTYYAQPGYQQQQQYYVLRPYSQ
jgi:hypothetical protein